MKYAYFVLFLLFVISGCGPKPDDPADLQAIQQVRQEFSNAVADCDFKKLRAQCTDDFLLVDNGRWWTMDSLINSMWALQGKLSVTSRFENVIIHTNGTTGWMAYKKHAEVTMGDQHAAMEWSESAVFIKQKKEWKLSLLHSTQLNPK